MPTLAAATARSAAFKLLSGFCATSSVSTLRLASIAAIAMVVYGGVQYIMSQDEPDKTKQARSTIINALIGLVVAVAATTLITFIAGRF